MSGKHVDHLARARVLEALAVAAARFPDLRICQIIGNAVPACYSRDPYYVTDEALHASLQRYLAAQGVSLREGESR